MYWCSVQKRKDIDAWNLLVCVCACEYVSVIVSHSHWKLFQKNRIAMGIVWRVCVCVWYTRAFSLCALPIYNGKISNKIASYAHTGQAKRFVARYSDYMFLKTLFLARRFGFYCHTPCDEVDYPLFSAIRACRTNMNSSRKLSIGSLNLEWNEAVPLKMYALYKMPRIQFDTFSHRQESACFIRTKNQSKA